MPNGIDVMSLPNSQVQCPLIFHCSLSCHVWFVVERYMEGDASVVFPGAQWLRERFLCECGGAHESPLIASSVSHPRRARLWRCTSGCLFFFQCWACVLRGTAMFRACVNRMTRASILHVVCIKIINMWSGVLSARSALRLFRSFLQCSMFVRWHSCLAVWHVSMSRTTHWHM